MTPKPKIEYRIIVENYAGKRVWYLKRDKAMAEKDADAYRTHIMSDGGEFYSAVWVETREVTPWHKVEGSETRRNRQQATR